MLAEVSTAPQAQAAPGDPGEPGPGSVVFAEGFENYADTRTPFTYSTFAAAGNPAYVASPMWSEGARCNGVILNQNMDLGGVVEAGVNTCNPSAGVQSYNFLRMLPQALEQAFPTTGASHRNTAVSSYTECKFSGPGNCDTLPVGTTVATGWV